MRTGWRKSVGAGALAMLLAACARPSAQEVLSDTAANLGRIDSGVLAMRMLTEASGQLAGEMGFELEGSFSLPVGDETLPVAEFRYTQIAGPPPRPVWGRSGSTGGSATPSSPTVERSAGRTPGRSPRT
jgi:hypothetical protein